MKPLVSVAGGMALMLLATSSSWPAPPTIQYTPPVTFENRKGVSDPQVWFGREVRTGRWCALDRATFERRSKSDELEPDFGWARFDARGLQSVTYAQTSEDAYSEDRYFIGPANRVLRMVRTAHYITDPWLSVTFEPDGDGRLTLTPSSRAEVRKMQAAGWDPYFVEWDHFSNLRQLPFARLIDFQSGAHIESGC